MPIHIVSFRGRYPSIWLIWSLADRPFVGKPPITIGRHGLQPGPAMSGLRARGRILRDRHNHS